ncbi:MAG: biosis protein MshI [Moraxellaceae bacterium]|jgi:MSHA biogenesis protein MshI|nr:biosis protein MshI [Moraxellaceae bacterium]
MISAPYWQYCLPRWKSRLKKLDARLGLSVGSTGLAWVHMDQQGDGLAVKACGYLQGESQSVVWARFRSVVNLQKFQGLSLHVALAPADYQLLLMEGVDVPAEELREAMRWRLGDLISFPATEAAVDVFTLPEDAYRGHQRMLYTAVCQQRQIEALRVRADSLKLKLASVSIPEIALCRLAQHLLEGEDSTAILQVMEGGSLLGIFQGGALYLVRQMAFSHPALVAAQYDNVLLEIQRSFDYFDSQIGKGMLRQLLLTPFPGMPTLAAHLAANLDVPVRPLDLASVWPAAGTPPAAAETVDPALLAACLPAVGVVMRAEA